MKKLLMGFLVLSTLSGYAAPILEKGCSGADVSKESLGTVMAVLNKKWINKKLSGLNGSEIMTDLGIDFRRTSEGECIEQRKVEDLSNL